MIHNEKFIGMHYRRGNRSIRMQIGDEVIIHPTRWGRSQATISYPAKIKLIQVSGAYEGVVPITEIIALKGIRENETWHGAWINDYAFNRLEFVCRGTNSQIDLTKRFRVKEYNKAYDGFFGTNKGWVYVTNNLSKSACLKVAKKHYDKTGLKTSIELQLK